MSSRKKSARDSTECSLRSWTLYIDECIDSPLLPGLLAEAELVAIRHFDRWNGERGKLDPQWVSTIWAEKMLIVTSDHGKGNEDMLVELAKVSSPCIFIPQAPPAQHKIWLGDYSNAIGRALFREGPMLFLINRNGELEGRYHDRTRGRFSILGNGKVRPKKS